MTIKFNLLFLAFWLQFIIPSDQNTIIQFTGTIINSKMIQKKYPALKIFGISGLALSSGNKSFCNGDMVRIFSTREVLKDLEDNKYLEVRAVFDKEKE